MSNKVIHGVLKEYVDSIKNISGEEIKGTAKIYVDVPVVPRWLSDILTKIKAESFDYTQLKAKYDLTMISYADLEQLSWIEQHKRIVDLAVALGVWVVEKEDK